MGYDALLLLALSFGYGAVMTLIVARTGGDHDAWQPMFNGPLFFLSWLLLLMLFYVWFWHKSGQTLGMRTWRIQVVDNQQQTPPNWRQSIYRSLAGSVSFICLGAGYWFALFHPRRACLHDLLSDTRVVVVPKPDRKQSLTKSGAAEKDRSAYTE